VFNGNLGALATAGRDRGGRAPAPGSLGLVQALVNTLSVESGRDLLGTRETAAAWLTAAGLLPAGPALFAEPALSAAEHAALLELREAIRAVLAAHTSQAADPAAADRLTRALASCRLAVTARPDGGMSLASADHHPFSRALGAVAVAIAEAAVAGTWARLKSCSGHLCGWAFYDRSAAARSRWCSMQLCGARAKMRTYRARYYPRPVSPPRAAGPARTAGGQR
jgi:predicted RNA-binding Zn ribbon-like protein